jgi:hypothetical protein
LLTFIEYLQWSISLDMLSHLILIMTQLWNSYCNDE